jgi:hypothetical protein
MRRIGIVGSRRRDGVQDFLKVEKALLEIFSTDDWIVSGGCPKGGDRFAEVLAKNYGISILIHYPDWKRFGKAAGFHRNTKIAKDASILTACVALDRTGGTEDTVKKFVKLHGQDNLILV